MVVMMPLKPAQLKLSPLGGAVFHISDQKSTTKFIFQLRLFIYMLINRKNAPSPSTDAVLSRLSLCDQYRGAERCMR